MFLAERHDAVLHVLHVNEREPDWNDVIDIQTEDVLADLHMDVEAAPAATAARVEQHEVTHPSAVDGILNYAAEHDVDLIVMGTHGRKGMERAVIGSVAENVVRRADCPVLTLVENAADAPAAQINRLLVAVDFSEAGEAIVETAREIALAYDAEIDLVHVLQSVALPGAYGAEPLQLDDDAIEEEFRARLHEAAQPLREADLAVTPHLLRGHPAEALLDFAADHPVDLIVLATHGRTGVRRFLLGSVAEKTLRRAPCPVFIVKSFGKRLVGPE